MRPVKTFITSRDVEDSLLRGVREIKVDADTVVTAEAEERAARLGVRLIPAAVDGGPAPGAGPGEAGPPHGAQAPYALPPTSAAPGGGVRVAARLDLLVRGGTVVLPGAGTLQADVWVKDGKVVGLAAGGPQDAATVVDAAGCYVMPGVVDPHVHLGLFAPLEEELESESRSALLGGVTTLGCYFGGNSSHLPLLSRLGDLVRAHSYTDLFPHLVIGTREQLEELPGYVERGVTSFKLYMCGIPGLIPEVDDGFILAAMRRCAGLPRPCVVCVHAENAAVVRWESEEARARIADPDLRQWAATHPDLAEAEAIRRASFLAQEAGVPVYFVHVTSARGLEAVRRARAEGAVVYAEVASPYLVTTWESERGGAAKMVPPFRGPHDREALWEGLADGTVTTLGTDNVTMTAEAKGLGRNLWEVMPGYPALATHLVTVLNQALGRRNIPLPRLAELMCRAPAEVFGLYPRKGTLLPGSDADMVVVDPARRRAVRAGELGSRADFSIFEGADLRGWPRAVVKAGEVVVREGSFTARSPAGRLLKR